MTKPKGTPEQQIAKKLFTITKNAVGDAFAIGQPKKKELPKTPEAKTESGKKLVEYLKSHPSAFGCNRPDVLGVLGAITGEDLPKLVNIQATEPEEEDDTQFNEEFNDGKCVGMCVWSIKEDCILMMSDLDNDYYIDSNCTFCLYYFDNRRDIRMPTLEEIEEFITNLTLIEFKKRVLCL